MPEKPGGSGMVMPEFCVRADLCRCLGVFNHTLKAFSEMSRGRLGMNSTRLRSVSNEVKGGLAAAVPFADAIDDFTMKVPEA